MYRSDTRVKVGKKHVTSAADVTGNNRADSPTTRLSPFRGPVQILETACATVYTGREKLSHKAHQGE